MIWGGVLTFVSLEGGTKRIKKIKNGNFLQQLPRSPEPRKEAGPEIRVKGRILEKYTWTSEVRLLNHMCQSELWPFPMRVGHRSPHPYSRTHILLPT